MVKQILARFIQRVFEVASSRTLAKAETVRRAEARALFTLSSIAPAGYVPWPLPSLSPVTLATLLNDIVLNSRLSVVELGSGLSTVYLARVLQDRGGRLWSVDQDIGWCRVVKEMAERENVGSCLQMVAAPLATNTTRNYEGPWYDMSVLSQQCPSEGIDLLIVDGPASDLEAPLIRYPAAAFFRRVCRRPVRSCSTMRIGLANRL